MADTKAPDLTPAERASCDMMEARMQAAHAEGGEAYERLHALWRQHQWPRRVPGESIAGFVEVAHALMDRAGVPRIT